MTGFLIYLSIVTKFKQLQERIFALSEEKQNWLLARLEWEVKDIYYDDEGGQCECGQQIFYFCVIQNRLTKEKIIVGSNCINQFFYMPEIKRIFDAFKRLKKDPATGTPSTLINLCWRNKIISNWDYGFSIRTCKKRIMSEKQMAQRLRINNKIIASFKPS